MLAYIPAPWILWVLRISKGTRNRPGTPTNPTNRNADSDRTLRCPVPSNWKLVTHLTVKGPQARHRNFPVEGDGETYPLVMSK